MFVAYLLFRGYDLPDEVRERVDPGSSARPERAAAGTAG